MQEEMKKVNQDRQDQRELEQQKRDQKFKNQQDLFANEIKREKEYQRSQLSPEALA